MTWNIINNVIGRGQNSYPMNPFLNVGHEETSCNVAVQALNDYFLNVTENLKTQTYTRNSPTLLSQKHQQRDFFPMQHIPVTEGEVKSIIKSLKSKNSYDYDGISPKVLKLCGVLIGKPLAYICSKSIATGTFPERLKYATVVPLHKKGDISDMANYRPISLLTTFSKVLETAMYYGLNQHLQINNILVSEQHGFRKGLSTGYAAHSLTNSILTAWNNKPYVGGIFCDLSKAFDCVDHNILKMKLQYYGLHKETIDWFESYLPCRKQ
jgi:hypothetical protein